MAGALQPALRPDLDAMVSEAGGDVHFSPTVPRRRSEGQPHEIVGHAWRAQQRLHRRYRHLVGHGKRTPVAVAAIARELVGFIWGGTARVPGFSAS
jgi:transposase